MTTESRFPIPENEKERVAFLHSIHLLDTPEDKAMDCITRSASALFGAPTALFSVLDSDRQWFKSKCGLEATQTSREVSFCTHAILQKRVMVVPNALEDERFRQNPLVTGEPHIRFYAGAPVIVPDGIILGTLCLLSPEPRYDFDEQQQQRLADLAHVLGNLVELRVMKMVDA